MSASSVAAEPSGSRAAASVVTTTASASIVPVGGLHTPRALLAFEVGRGAAGPDVVAEPCRELVGQPLHTSPRPEEHRPRLGFARASHSRLRPAEQRTLGGLPGKQLGERRPDRELVDVARVEPGEQRRDRAVGDLVAEPATEHGAERDVGVVAALGLPEVGERAAAASPRHAGPAEHVAEIAGDAERRAGRVRDQPAFRPQVRAGRARLDQLTADPELATQLDRPRLARQERVRSCGQRQTAHVDAAELATGNGASASSTTTSHDGSRWRSR